jgi:hypothetical protein
MKKLAIALLALASGVAGAQVYVQPYVRSDGTYVQGYYRSAPDRTPLNNYGTQGNVNPYTGQQGTVNPYALPMPQAPLQVQPVQPTYPFPGNGGRPQGRAF